MNKTMFYSGLSVFIVEVIGILYFFYRNSLVFTVFALFNIFAFICMVVGLISNNNYKGGTR